MTEPRLEDSASAFERELLQAGSAYRVSAESREKTLAALGLGAAVGAASVTTAAQASLLGKLASTKAWLQIGWVKGALVGVAAIGAVATAPTVYRALSSEAPAGKLPAVSSPQVSAPRVSASQVAPPIPQPPEAPENRVVEPPAEQAEPANGPAPASEPGPANDGADAGKTAPERDSSAKGSRSAAKADPPEVTTEALRAELAALDAARAKLSSGSPKGALTALDDYQRSHPRGLLRLEAEVLRIDALAQAGQTQAAKERASAFLRQHPKGVLAARVRRYAEP